MSRRAESMLALIHAKADLDRAKQNASYLWGSKTVQKDFYEDEQATYDAAVAEYEAAHAPTSEEVKDHLLEHLDTDVDVNFEGGEVAVEFSLEWIEDCEVAAKFGHCQGRDYYNQCLGECC